MLQIVHTLAEHRWRAFVAGHQQGNIFHTPEMHHLFARAAGHRPELWAVVAGERILALLPVVKVTLNRRLRHLTTRAIAYGGLLCSDEPDGQRALSLLLQTYTATVGRDVLFTELRHLTDMTALTPLLRRHGFHHEEHLNFLIDLSRRPEEILQTIGRRTRKHIRRGLRRGQVRVAGVQHRSELTPWYAILQRTYRTANIPLADKSLFEAAFDLLVPRRMARFTLAWVGERAVAASVELLYKTTVYGWYGGTDRSYSRLCPTEILTWHILKWGAERGYRCYDFGGAGKPGEKYGVRDFKAKFGGRPVNYGRDTCIHAPGRLRLSRLGYALYRAGRRTLYHGGT